MINLFLMKQSSLRISADTVLSYQKLQNKEVNLQKLCISEVMDQKIIQIYISTLQKEHFQKRNLINSEAMDQKIKSAASVENLRISEEPTVRRSPRLVSAHLEDVILGKKDDPIST